jgi:vitamin B12 transport system substrate-binding protein
VQSYELIEKIFDKKSTKLTANLLQQLDLIKTLGNNTAIKNKSVFVQIGWNPLVTVSKSTLIGEVIESSGLVNLYGNSAVPYPKPSQEDVVSKNPDYILIFPMTSSKAEHEDSKKIWLDFTNLSAVRSKKLHIFPVGTLTKPGFDFYQGLITFYKVLNK